MLSTELAGCLTPLLGRGHERMQEVIVLLSEPWQPLKANLLPLTMHNSISGRAWGLCFGVNITWAADAAD